MEEECRRSRLVDAGWRGDMQGEKEAGPSVRKEERTPNLALLLVSDGSQYYRMCLCVRGSVLQDEKRQNRCLISATIVTTGYRNKLCLRYFYSPGIPVGAITADRIASA